MPEKIYEVQCGPIIVDDQPSELSAPLEVPFFSARINTYQNRKMLSFSHQGKYLRVPLRLVKILTLSDDRKVVIDEQSF